MMLIWAESENGNAHFSYLEGGCWTSSTSKRPHRQNRKSLTLPTWNALTCWHQCTTCASIDAAARRLRALGGKNKADNYVNASKLRRGRRFGGAPCPESACKMQIRRRRAEVMRNLIDPSQRTIRAGPHFVEIAHTRSLALSCTPPAIFMGSHRVILASGAANAPT